MKYVIVGLVVLSSVFAHNYHGITLAPDNLHGWVVCLDTALIFHTTDGGVTWTEQQNIPANAKRIFDVTCFDELNAWTCGILGEILFTVDGGSLWEVQTSGLAKYATRIEFIDSAHGWAACGDGTVGRTESGGGTWEQIFTPWYTAEYYGVSFVNQLDGWVVAGYPDSLLTGQGLIISSNDGGIDWTLLYESPGYEDFFDVHFFHLLDGIIVGGDETDYSPLILKTTNAGLDWDTIPAPANTYYLRAVDFVGDHGWAVGRFGTIIYTNDAGNTWTFQNNPAVNTLFDVDFTDTLHGLTCGDGIILRTTDGGQTWIDAGIHEHESEKTANASLQVHPNPFTKLTAINFEVGSRQYAVGSLKIYDITGKLVKQWNYPTIQPSNHITWDGTDEVGNKVSVGVYVVRLESDGFTATEKITVLK